MIMIHSTFLRVYIVLISIPTGIKKVLRFCCVAIWLLPLLLALASLFFFSIYRGTQATGEALYKNGSVLVDNNGFDTFFQSALNVKTSATSTSGLSFYRHSCSNLPTTNSTSIQVVRKEQQVDTETNIPLYYEYLADGSSVCFHANITGKRNLTDCAAAIYVLDDWHAYSSAFIDGNNITNNISKYCLNISSTDQPNTPQCFRVPHSGFFFFGAYVPGKDQGLGVELAIIQIVANKVLYDTSALKPVCEIMSGEGTRQCLVKIFDGQVSVPFSKKMCILMTVQEENTDIQTLSYSAVPTSIRNLGTIISLVATVFAIILFFSVVLCVMRVNRTCVSRPRTYQPF